MNRTNLVWCASRAAAAAALMACANAFALSYVMMRDEALVDESDGVALVEVVGRQPAATGDIATLYLVRTVRDLGRASTRAVERLALPGAQPDSGVGFRVDGVPTLRTGDRVLLFYDRRKDGVLVADQLTLGLFFELEADGARFYHRQLAPSGELAKRNLDFHQARDAARFEDWIAARTAGVARPIDYLVDETAVEGSAKFTQIRDDGDNNPVRWFKFDANQTESWLARSDGQAGMVTDEFAEFQQALAAWTNDAGSKILYVYGGTTAAADTSCASPSVISWNDPNNEIGGSYNCAAGGVLAFGGPCWFSSTQNYNGVPYHSVFEGRVVVQDNAGCAFDGHGGADGAEILTHEVGHTLGLDHSCGDSASGACVPGSTFDQATMRASAHTDGRGAVLGADDKAAVASIYVDSSSLIFANGFE